MINTLKIEYAISAAAAKEPEVGDIFVFASKNNNVYLEWIVVRYHPDNHNSILLAPVDDFFLKGTPDLDLSLYMKRRYIVRCGQTDWFPKNMCQNIPNKSAKVGKISGIVLTLIRNRISDLARGIGHDDDINKDDDDANYEEYMEEVASVREQLLENN